MAHKRSPEALQRGLERKEAKILVMKNAFMDREKGEMVNLLSGEQINGLLLETFGSLLTVDSRYEKGEVLTDNRARGSLQQIPGRQREPW